MDRKAATNAPGKCPKSARAQETRFQICTYPTRAIRMAGVAQDRHKYNAEYSKGRSLCKAAAVIHSVHIGFMATIAPCQVKCIPAQNKLASPAFPQLRLGPDKK